MQAGVGAVSAGPVRVRELRPVRRARRSLLAAKGDPGWVRLAQHPLACTLAVLAGCGVAVRAAHSLGGFAFAGAGPVGYLRGCGPRFGTFGVKAFRGDAGAFVGFDGGDAGSHAGTVVLAVHSAPARTGATAFASSYWRIAHTIAWQPRRNPASQSVRSHSHAPSNRNGC